MPTYVYKITGDGPESGTYFEVEQSIADAPLSVHPESGDPVTRVICAPALVLKHGERRTNRLLSDESVARNGFTRYEKIRSGVYEKTAGHGPDRIHRDQ